MVRVRSDAVKDTRTGHWYQWYDKKCADRRQLRHDYQLHHMRMWHAQGSAYNHDFSTRLMCTYMDSKAKGNV